MGNIQKISELKAAIRLSGYPAIRAFNLNVDDLEEKFTRETPLPGTINISNYISLKSEILTPGLKSLYDSLNALDGFSSIENLRKKYSSLLLQDLEKHSNLPEFYRGEGTPDFKQEFYQQVSKLKDLKGGALEEVDKKDLVMGTITWFVDYCSNSKIIKSPQFISAKMLLELYKDNATLASVKESLDKALNEYKEHYQRQVKIDIGGIEDIEERGRDAILLKDQSGETKLIDMGELEKLSTLTPEQIDFIKTSWHQGTFGSGWFAISCFKNDLLKKISEAYGNGEDAHIGHMKFASNNFLLVDISTENEVKLYNQCNTQVRTKMEPGPNNLIDCVTGVLEVDVSNLKGKTFIPGCASSQPTINVYISAFDSKINLEFPKNVVVESLEADQKRQQLTLGSIKGCLHEIEISGKHRDKAINLLITLKGEAAAADLILPVIITSNLSNEEKMHILEATTTTQGENFFTDSITTLAAELIAKAKFQEVIKKTIGADKLSDQYIKFIEFISVAKNSFDNSSMSQKDNPLGQIASKISERTNQQEKYFVEAHEGLEQKLAVENYVFLETDQEKQEQFANKQLAKYCQAQTVEILGKSETDRIASALISILTPICKNDQEKKALRNNADLVVRECARYGGEVRMSFGQKWHAYIIDPIKRLLGRGIEMPKCLKEHPELITSINNKKLANPSITNTLTAEPGEKLVPCNPRRGHGR